MKKLSKALMKFWKEKIKTRWVTIVMLVLASVFSMDFNSLKNDTYVFLDRLDEKTERIIELTGQLTAMDSQLKAMQAEMTELRRCMQLVSENQNSLWTEDCEQRFYGDGNRE